MKARNSYNAGCLYTQCQRGEYKGGGGAGFAIIMVILSLAAVGGAVTFLG